MLWAAGSNRAGASVATSIVTTDKSLFEGNMLIFGPGMQWVEARKYFAGRCVAHRVSLLRALVVAMGVAELGNYEKAHSSGSAWVTE